MLSELRNSILLSVLAIMITGSKASAQKITSYPLKETLNEISGLEIINDSLLVAFNDGGNGSNLYLLDWKGKILKKIDVKGAKNRDWEDITTDGKNIYIGDIGNNLNDHKKLRIYKVKIKDLLEKEEVEAKMISFSYKEQKSFPPSSDSLFFDAEGMTFYNDSIWVFTKNRATNSDGKAWVYKIPSKVGNYKVEHAYEIYIGDNGWMIDGITAADNYGDKFYLLTYNRYIVMQFTGKAFKKVSEYEFENLAQREALVLRDKDTMFVADEKNAIIGDVKLHRIELK